MISTDYNILFEVVGVGKSGNNCKSQFSSTYPMDSEIKLRSSDMMESTFTTKSLTKKSPVVS